MNRFVEAARPRTLPAAVAPVLVGTVAAAAPVTAVDPLRAGLALVVALSLQIAVNYANDYFDGVRGVDTDVRVGPRRAVATGLVSPARMRVAIAAALVVAALAGLALALLVGLELLLVGAVAIVAALGYSGGPRPYASAALGEVFVFVFFGVVATVGSAYVQDGAVTMLAVVVSVPMGALATALLVVNNLRDIDTDAAVGKRTLAVRLGERRTRDLYLALLATAVLSLGVAWAVAGSGWVLLPVVGLAVALPAVRLVRGAPLGPELVPALAATARTQLVFAVLLAVGIVVAERSTG